MGMSLEEGAEVICRQIADRGIRASVALGAFGRLAAEYTLVNNIFTAPLPDGLADELATVRAERLDGHTTDYSPIDTAEWSPSGATKAATR